MEKDLLFSNAFKRKERPINLTDEEKLFLCEFI